MTRDPSYICFYIWGFSLWWNIMVWALTISGSLFLLTWTVGAIIDIRQRLKE